MGDSNSPAAEVEAAEDIRKDSNRDDRASASAMAEEHSPPDALPPAN